MSAIVQQSIQPEPGSSVEALCPLFGECGGCLYQNFSYEAELRAKVEPLKMQLTDQLFLAEGLIEDIIPSPKPYHYRNRLDLKMKRTKDGSIFIGFTPNTGRGVLPVEACYIADKNISAFIPELKRQVADRLPDKYRNANLVVRTGDDGRVLWGGIGRRSCQLDEQDYFWTEIQGRKIFYSLDTFFQANLSILPKVLDVIRSLDIWTGRPVFYDLYGGVGLFGIGLSDFVHKVILIEENVSSLKLARYNVRQLGYDHFDIIDGRVEDLLPDLLKSADGRSRVIMVDPPRAGLAKEACVFLAGLREVDHMLYLSCHPDSLTRDLKILIGEGWVVQRVIPFDFFPKTRHLETLVLLDSKRGQTPF